MPAAAVQRLAGPVGDYLPLTLAVQVMTLPVTLYHFGRLSPVSLLGLFWLPLGQLAAYLA